MSGTRDDRNRNLSRRRLLQGAAYAVPAALVPGVAGLAGSAPALAADAKGPITFLTWGGHFGAGIRKAFSDPFTKATGIKIVDVTPFSFGKFKTALTHGNPEGYDIAWFDDEVEPYLAGDAGLLEPIDYSLLPNAKMAIPSTRQKYAASPYITLYQMCYNTKSYSNKAPNSWADFWNVKDFPGPRSLGTWVNGVLEAALMADGVKPGELYPLDEDRAFKMLDKIKPHIRVFTNTQSGDNVYQMLEQGDVTMVLTWATDVLAAHLAGKPVNVVFNQGFYFSPAVGIAKGTPRVKEAHAYLNTFFDPQAELTFIRAWPTSPADPAVMKLMTEKEQAATAIAHLKEMVHFDPQYYAKNEIRLQQKYDSWRVL